MKNILYSGDSAYQVVRTISIDSCSPKKYGIDKDDKESHMKVLKVWVDQHNCDHVLQQQEKFLLCRSIKDVEIIE